MKVARISFVVALGLLAIQAVPAQDNPSHDSKSRHKKYRLVDLGTFGGSQGYISQLGFEGLDGGGPVINAQGFVVGSAETSVFHSASPNTFYCPGPNVFHAFRSRQGQPTDLGALSPARDNCSDALAIGDNGKIVGESENGLIDPLIGVTQIRAVVWRNGTILNLGTLGGNASAALGINAQDEIVGFALNNIPDPYSVYGLLGEGSSNSTQTRGFLWRDGRMRDLGSLGGPDTYAGLLNDRGQVAGNSYTNSTPNPVTGLPTLDPFLWDRGVITDLGTLGGNFGIANALSKWGQVVGFSDLAGDLTFHPFLWDDGRLKDLGTLGGSTGQAEALNNTGEIVGVADLPGDRLHDAFLWQHGVMTDLGNLGRTSHAFSINSSGTVVGNSTLADGVTIHSFIWERGHIADLNDLVSPRSDATLVDVVFIADDGKIMVNGLPQGCFDQFSCGHPYLLIPDGDCDDENEARMAASQAVAASLRREATDIVTVIRPSLPPIERIRNQMWRHHNIAGQSSDSRE